MKAVQILFALPLVLKVTFAVRVNYLNAAPRSADKTCFA